jgi:S-layer protein
MALQGFVESEYLAAKLAALQANSATATDWASKTPDQLKEFMANVGMNPEEHYQAFGWKEGLAPNNLFSAAEYKLAKATDLFNKGLVEGNTPYGTVAEAQAAFEEAWGDVNPYLHYVQFGSAEGINPSNAFDESAYLASKLAALQANEDTAEEWKDKTVNDVKAAFAAAGLSALGHYQMFGKYEGIAVTEVPADEQVTSEQDSGVPGETYRLTSGIDVFTGTNDNDTFNANEDPTFGDTLTALDEIDGGAGNDTLGLTSTTAVAIPASASVKNVETANIKSAVTVDGDFSAWAGLNTLNVNSFGGQTKGVTAGATTDVTLTESALKGGDIIVDGGSDVTVTSTTKTTAGTIGVGATTAAAGDVVVTSNVGAGGKTGPAITVDGGTTVTVAQNMTNPVATTNTAGAVVVNGNASTTTVDVSATKAAIASATKAGVVNNTVTVADANYTTTDDGTITDVTVNGYTTLALNASSVTDLTLANGSGNVTVDNSDKIKVPVTALNLTLDGTTGGVIDDADIWETLNVTVAGKSTVANITSTAVDTLNIAGSALLTSGVAGLTGLTDVTVTESAALKADLSALGIKTFDATATDGNNEVKFDGTVAKLSVKGGAGDDQVATTGALAADAAVSLGAGDDTYGFDTAAAAGAKVDAGADQDTIAVINGALLNAAAASVYTNFEVLEVAGGTGKYDMSILGLTDLKLTDTALAGATTITDAAAATTLTFSVSGAADVILDGGFAFDYALADDTGKNDATSIYLAADDTDTDQTAEGQVIMTINAIDGIETLNIDSTATTASEESAAGKNDALSVEDYTNTLTITSADKASKVVITGDAQADVTLNDATGVLTQVIATDNTAGVTVDVSASTAGVTFNGSAADDTYTAGTAGDTIQGNAGADDITLGGGDDVVRFVAATDSQLTLKDTTTPADGKADTATGYDAITNFNAAGTDVIELSSSLGLASGDARSAVLQKGTITIAGGTVTPAEMETFIGDGVDFFDTGLVDRAVAFAEDGTDGFIFVDANGDGDFTQADDMFIELSGMPTFDVTDVQFG